MDPLSRLQALTGQKNVVDNTIYPKSKPRSYVCEETDSEDEVPVVRSKAPPAMTNSKWHSSTSMNAGVANPSGLTDKAAQQLDQLQLVLGQLAPEDEAFCNFQTVKKYPFTFIGSNNRQKVAEGFFDQGKIFDYPWHFFYLYRIPQEGTPALLLVTTKQFLHFLELINKSLKVYLTFPPGANGAFEVKFDQNGSPRPRYLGTSSNQIMADRLRNNVPPSYYRPGTLKEPQIMEPTDRSLAAFQEKINLMTQTQRGKKTANKEKAKRERLEKQRAWKDSIKRVQRYLGVRECRKEAKEAIEKALCASMLPWDDIGGAVDAAVAKLPPAARYEPEKPAPFVQEGSVVFVCIDVEAWERNSKVVTEIGIATFDTNDIKSIAPGKQGENWMKLIRARHFRINEHMHYNNVEFVSGCADRFEFGESEFISLKDAPRVVASCFKHPFSKPGEEPGDVVRNIILVGHDVVADIHYLQTIGYDVTNLSTLLEKADTAYMWRFLKREPNPRNLGAILSELGIIGWNLHNAGNDAVYTLQAMIAMSLKHLDDRKKPKVEKEKEKKSRISEFLAEATETALDKEEGWSSAGEDSDGGVPVAIEVAPSKPSSSNSRDRRNNGTTYYNPSDTPTQQTQPRASSSRPKPTISSVWRTTPQSAEPWGSASQTVDTAGPWGAPAQSVDTIQGSAWGVGAQQPIVSHIAGTPWPLPSKVDQIEKALKDTKISSRGRGGSFGRADQRKLPKGQGRGRQSSLSEW